MKLKPVPLFVAAFALWSSLSGQAIAGPVGVIFNDTFDAGTPTKGDDPADPADIAFWTRGNVGGNLTLQVDEILGGVGNRALDFQVTGTGQIVLGSFDADMSDHNATNSGPVTLGIGERIILRLDMRYTGTVPDTENGWVFGVYGDPEGPVTGNNSLTATDNAPGYAASISTGSFTGSQLYRETGFDNILGGPAGSLDFISLGTGSGGISDTSKYSLRLELTRTESAIGLELFMNDSSVAAATDTTSIFTSFNTFAVKSLSSATTSDWRIDNVGVQVVPEPASAALLFGGVAIMGLLRRRRR